jgi:hypothetical protein
VGKLCWRAPQPAQSWQDVRAAGKFGPEGMQTAGRVVRHLGETDAAGTAILDLDRTDDDDLALVTASATTSHRTMLTAAGDLGFIDLDQSGERIAVR